MPNWYAIVILSGVAAFGAPRAVLPAKAAAASTARAVAAAASRLRFALRAIVSPSCRRLHPPPHDGAALEHTEEQLEGHPEDCDCDESRKDLRDLEKELRVVDVGPEPAFGAGDAEDELGGDDRPPAERPCRLQPGDRVRERRRSEDIGDQPARRQPDVAPDRDDRRVDGLEAGVERDRDRPR